MLLSKPRILRILVFLLCLAAILILAPKTLDLTLYLENLSGAYTQIFPGKWILKDGEIGLLPFPHLKLAQLEWHPTSHEGDLRILGKGVDFFFSASLSELRRPEPKIRMESAQINAPLTLKKNGLALERFLKEWRETESLRSNSKTPQGITFFAHALGNGLVFQGETRFQSSEETSLLQQLFLRIQNDSIFVSFQLKKPSGFLRALSKCLPEVSSNTDETWEIELNRRGILVKSWTMDTKKISLAGVIDWNGRVDLKSLDIALGGNLHGLACFLLN